jgi:hypothetical protein
VQEKKIESDKDFTTLPARGGMLVAARETYRLLNMHHSRCIIFIV